MSGRNLSNLKDQGVARKGPNDQHGFPQGVYKNKKAAHKVPDKQPGLPMGVYKDQSVAWKFLNEQDDDLEEMHGCTVRCTA
jgi:hypothetical protein